MCVVDPNVQTTDDRSPPPVILERVIADKQPFPAEETLPVSAPIRVAPGRGELEFHYTSLSLRVPERNSFKYKLEGVDLDWVEAGSRRVAYYNNIYPGEYRFHVLARNSDTAWGEPGALVDIVLLPHVWQTWWFKVALAAVLGLVFFALHRLRLARVREVEALRLRIAADLHDDVGSNLGTISLLSRKVQKDGAVREGEQEDLAAINRISMQTANSIREIVWFINPEYDTMQDLVLRMKEAAYAGPAGIECHFQTSEVGLSNHLPPPVSTELLPAVQRGIGKRNQAFVCLARGHQHLAEGSPLAIKRP